MKRKNITHKISRGMLIAILTFNMLSGLIHAQAVEVTQQDIENQNLKSALESVQDLRLSINDITQELFDLDAQERDNEKNISEKYRQTRNEIVRVIKNIDESTANVSDAIHRLGIYQKQIQSSMQQLKETRETSNQAKEYLAEFANLLYTIESELHTNGSENIDELRLMVQSDNVPVTLIGENITKAMALQLSDLIQQTDEAEKTKINIVRKLGELKSQVQKDITTYRDEVEKLQQKKAYLIKFIELYKNKQVEQSERFNQVFASKKEVNDAILSFIDEIVKKDYKTSFNIKEKIKELAKLPDDSSKLTSPVAWPIYPIEKITTYFNDPDFYQKNEFKHQGIQVQATQGTPVYSIRDGIVYHVFNNPDSISRVMVVHQNGYVSTYLYLSRINVEPGDVIKRGQLIGYSGGEAGTKGAGFISEGENLTFQIFKDGVAIDPLTVLDLSVVTNRQEVLPEEYRIKYLNDNLVRPIDVSNLKIEEGNSVDERSQSFLSRYAVGIYRDVGFWTEVVNGTNIDRDMVICVAFAESTLGNHLSTSNNIGNVGNNDRGDRIAYTSPFEGARLIALTMNNAYLGHYHTINQLSRYGNEDGKIYASSPINWQTNVLKCLSRIKGYYIPEDFPFRTGPNPNTAKNTSPLNYEE